MDAEIDLKTALTLVEPKVDPREFLIVHEQLPVYPISGWDASQILSAIDSHDQGNFFYSELLYHAMKKDARIGPALNTRVQEIRNHPFRLDMLDAAPKRLKVESKILERNYSEMFSDINQTEALARTIMFGFCIARQYFKVIDNQIVPIIEIWTQSNCWYNLTDRCFYVTTEKGETVPVVGDPWIIFTTGGERPWLNGAMRELALPFFLRSFNIDKWNDFNDVEALAYKHLSGPRMTREQQETGGLVAMARQMIGGDTVYTPNEYDFKLVTSQGRGAAYKTFHDFIDMANRDIAIILLGNNLTQEVKGGSFAATQTADMALIRKTKADVTYINTPIYNTSMRLWTEKNFTPALYGEVSLVRYRPKPISDVKEPEDQQALAKTAMDYSIAFEKFATSIGPLIGQIPIDWAEQARKCGISLKSVDNSSKVIENE